MLEVEASKQQFAVQAYCVMPDHLHALVRGVSPQGNLLQFIEAFKKKTSFIFLKRMRRELWQISYYDHVLRKSEEMSTVAWYIWMNPVRAGLARTAQEYPFSGPRSSAWFASEAPRPAWMPPRLRRADVKVSAT